MQLTPSQTRDMKTREVADLMARSEWPRRRCCGTEIQFAASFHHRYRYRHTTGGRRCRGAAIHRDAQLRYKLAEYPGVVDITDSFRAGKQELKLDTLCHRANPWALTLASLATAGPPGLLRRGGAAHPARTRRRARHGPLYRAGASLAGNARFHEDKNPRRLRGALRDGGHVCSLGRGFSTIRRADSRRVVNVVADVDRTRITDQ